MSAHAIIARPTSVEWDVVRGEHYIMEPSDFPEGCGVVFNPDTGVQIGTGKGRFGKTIQVRLYHPLCNCCDQPIPRGGICSECRTIHADVAEMSYE